MKTIIALVIAFTVTSCIIFPERGYSASRCDPYAPYYHATTNSLGSRLADLFLFPGTLAVAIGVAGGPRGEYVDHHGRRVVVAKAACMPVNLAHHFASGRKAPK